MKAMIDATFEFGRYPIQLEEGGVKGTFWTFQAKPKLEKVDLEEELKVEEYLSALLSKNVPLLIELVQKDMESGVAPSDVVSKGMIPAMRIVGEKFQSGEIYIPEMMFSAKAMSETLAHFKDQIVVKSEEKLGTVVLGTVKGDLHDIGKNLVGMMLAGQGFAVEDLGISVAPETFVQAIKEKKPEFVGISALLTTTMIEMKNTIAAIQEAGLRDAVKVIVGGAPVTQKFANDIGADGFAYDAPGAAQKCKELLSG
jgi:5-methyltetrahydrofolate--homocysteine methyltransferase